MWDPDGTGFRTIPDEVFRAEMRHKFWVTIGLMALFVFGTLGVILALPERV
jgi:hypothetical protein